MPACISPFHKFDKTHGHLHLPCGKCVYCMKRRVSGWYKRLLVENKICESARFVTLTYNTDNIPITESGHLTLDVKDFQRFMKRLRKAQDKRLREHKMKPRKIKYYAAGEYGEQGRPHWHVILFNADIDLVEQSWVNVNTGQELGNPYYGEVNEKTIKYTLKYLHKQLPSKVKLHESQEPQKQLISKGLGLAYVTKETKKWHKADLLNRCYIPMKNGEKIAMPRYLKERIYTKIERDKIALHFRNMHTKADDNKYQKDLEQTRKYFKNRKSSKL